MDYKKHESVLKNECVDFLIHSDLEIKKEYHFVDLTFGAGGHTFELASRGSNYKIIGVDQDPDALSNGLKLIREKKLEDQISLLSMNFSDFADSARAKEIMKTCNGFDGFLVDLGVSSHHFDEPSRGFSYRFDGPLDMRMNPLDEIPNAKDLVNSLDEESLVRMFFDFGEEKFSKRIAQKICEIRKDKPIETTKDLEDIVFHCYPKKWRYGKTNPSTRIFQALRIAVNRELDVLESLLDRIPWLLAPGGRFCVISFHSLEDRIVKHKFRDLVRNRDDANFHLVSKKPLLPCDEELERNSRSRSAKLRIIERKA